MPEGLPEPREIWISEVPVDDDRDNPFNHVVVVSANPNVVLFQAHVSDPGPDQIEVRVMHFEEFLGTYNCTGAIYPDPLPALNDRMALLMSLGVTSPERVREAFSPTIEMSDQTYNAFLNAVGQVGVGIGVGIWNPQANPLTPQANLLTTDTNNVSWVRVGEMQTLDGSFKPVYSPNDASAPSGMIKAEVHVEGKVVGHVLVEGEPKLDVNRPTQWERLGEDD
jgi:hypothetical protein